VGKKPSPLSPPGSLGLVPGGQDRRGQVHPLYQPSALPPFPGLLCPTPSLSQTVSAAQRQLSKVTGLGVRAQSLALYTLDTCHAVPGLLVQSLPTDSHLAFCPRSSHPKPL
jgi:hypothetical protein